MNPFKKSPAPLGPGDAGKYIRVGQTWAQLNALVDNNENTVILGVEGSGKTTLLQMFFNPDYCAQSAARGKLVFFADLSMTLDDDDLCQYLLSQLKDAVEKDLPEDVNARFLQYLPTLAGESIKRKFILACEKLFAMKYTLLLVMDGFERFVSSPKITQAQHEMLRTLLDKNIMRCVVATNYDLEKSSLPEDIQGSLYLQKFQAKVTMPGFTLEEAEAFVSSRISQDDPIRLDQQKIKTLHNLTGGIPYLFELAASHRYDLLEKQVKVTRSELQSLLYHAAQPTMHRWFKIFPVNYADAVSYIVSSFTPDKGWQKVRVPIHYGPLYFSAACLKNRGFLINPKANVQDTYAFNSPLLQQYVLQEYLSGTAAAQLPGQQPANQKKEYNVFISYKRTADSGKTVDSEIALAIYEKLHSVKGLVPFLDVKEMPYGIGGSDFTDTIFAALDTAKAFVFVCTQPNFLDTPYIATEWKAYTEELASGRKPHGSVFGVVENVNPTDIPLRLRYGVELLSNSPEELNRLVTYLKTRLCK